jgi:hypothetical protein
LIAGVLSSTLALAALAMHLPSRKVVPSTNNAGNCSHPVPVQDTGPRFVDARHLTLWILSSFSRKRAISRSSISSAKNPYVAGKEAYWQAFSVSLPQLLVPIQLGIHDYDLIPI